MKRSFERIIAVVFAGLVVSCSAQAPSSTNPGVTKTPSGGTGSPSASLPQPLSIASAEPNTNAGLKIGDPITVHGTGFSSSTKVFLGNQPVTPLEVSSEDTIRFPYSASLAGLAPGPASLSVEDTGVPLITADGAFFHFPSPGWDIFPNFLDGRVRDLALSPSGALVVATDEGIFSLQGGRFLRGASEDVEICGPDSQTSGGCPSGLENLCLLADPSSTCFVVKQVEALPATGEVLALAEQESSGQRKVLKSADGLSWQALPPFGANPLSIKTAGNKLYVLTADSMTVGTPSSWDDTLPLSSEMRQIAAAETSPPFDDFTLAILDKGSEIDLSVGTPKGLFQGAYLPASHSPVTWLFSGPSANCGNVNGVPTFCGPKITALAIDPIQETLYFSYIPHESWPSGDDGAVESLPVGSLNATVVSLIPWINNLALVDGSLLGAGWNPVAKDKDSLIYNLSLAGSHIYSRFQTLGLPSLPSSASDEVTRIREEGGTFYAYLRARHCLLASPVVPGLGVDVQCLGAAENFHQGVLYLFLQSGSLFAATLQGTFTFNPATSAWESSGVSASESLRQDLDLSVVTHTDGLPESASCAVPIPDLDLVFACTSHGAYVSFHNGRWEQVAGEAPIVSLAYDAQEHQLYGASNTQGIFRLPLP